MKPDFSLLRWAALFEGTSLLALLFIAMPLKYYADIPLAVKIIGPAHGMLFIGYISLLLFHSGKNELSLTNTLLGFVSAMLPFGSFIYKYKVLR